MDSGNSKEINDSLEDIRRRYHEVFLKLREADKSNAEPKQCLFPKNKSVKPPIRESMVRRACVKTNVVSSTPMTCAKKQKFTSDRLPSMSPISTETLLKNPNNSRKERTSDSIMFDQPCSSRHDTSSCKELETSRKREYLNTIISKIASNKKQRQDQSQTSFSNSQRKQTTCSRTCLRSMARNLFNSSVVDCGIQTGPSLTTNNTEYNSLEEEQMLNNCEKGKLISKKFYDMADGELFPGKKNDTGGPWRVSSGLQLYNNLDQDSFLALNISADTDTSDDEFLPKRPPQKKVFINKKIGGLPKKEENCRRKSIVSNVPSNKESPKKSKLKNQSQTNDALDSKNKKQNITKTSVLRMVQIERQIESCSSDYEIFNVPKESVQEKSIYLSKNMEIVCNNNDEVDCTLTTNNASVKPKRGRSKKKSDSRDGNFSVKPCPSPKFTQTSQDISTETLHQAGKIEQQKFRRSTRMRRQAVKLTSHVLVCRTQKVFDKVTKNTQNIPFINLSNDDKLTKRTSKLLSPVEETENENSGCEGLQNTRTVYKKKQPKNKFGKIRKRPTDKEMSSNIARALNETVEQPATFETLLNIEDHRHIQTRKCCFNNPKFKNLTNMDGISIFTLDSGISGLLKIAPKKVKPKQFIRNHDLYFVVIEGHCKVEIQNERHTLSKLGLFLVRQGADYCIENISDTEDLVLNFYRFKH